MHQIYPYTLGVILCIFSFLGILIAFTKMVLENKINQNHLILGGTFLSYFIFNSLLFTKWTRFVHPTFPFLIIFSFIGIYEIVNLLKNSTIAKQLSILLLTLLIVPTLLWGVMFFSIYLRQDVRVSATNWANVNIPKNTTILTETGNSLEVPLGGNYHIISFDFYNVDTDPTLYNNLINNIYKSDYFIIQSRRIYKNHNDKTQFPIVYNFYKSLFSGKLGFEETRSFSSFPQFKLGKFTYTIDDEVAEETWSVFDHPVVRIFKKTKPYSLQNYEQLLRQ
jgi:hypothetical protein